MFIANQLGAGAPPAEVAGELRLPYALRSKSRARVPVTRGRLAGQDIGLDLPRGTVLRDGDLLFDANQPGLAVRVIAATEQLLEARATDPLQLARIAYHLGNRHVPLQLGEDEQGGWLRLEIDHVLENMIVGLGGQVAIISAGFDPESGAYGHGGHRHASDPVGPAEPAVPAAATAGRHDDRRHAPRIHDFIEQRGGPERR
jgi:urease accessory protein